MRTFTDTAGRSWDVVVNVDTIKRVRDLLVVGVAPGRLTLRQLLWMAEARGRDNWNHTSAVLAMIANWNKSRAARLLGIDRKTLLKKITDYRLRPRVG